MSMLEIERIKEAAAFIQEKVSFEPELGIVLGTGLGNLLNHVEITAELEYKNIPHFVDSTVEFHSGKLVFGMLEGKPLVAMHGRFHYYEGYSMQEITRPIRVMKLLGIKHLLVSNAAGGLNPTFQKSDLMIINDHIDPLPANPLTGTNIDELGPRFPDMSQPYSKQLNNLLIEEFNRQQVAVNKGVYVSVPGPNLETAAEYRYLKLIGADAVGMSTIPEVIVANHMSLPCCAVSVITDLCDPDNLEPVDINDIIQAAMKGEEKLIPIIKGFVRGLA
jgi:purine-nucleoside phosphorylase